MIEQVSTQAEESPSETLAPPLPPVSTELAKLSSAQLADLGDEAKQAEYQRQFELQMNRRYCPGCGE